MISQLKTAATRPSQSPVALAAEQAAPKVDFASALKSTLDQVNQAQRNSEAMTQRFVLGDDKINLSDVMLNSQKANISFQATVQVRNKLVSAYQDIMNMSI